MEQQGAAGGGEWQVAEFIEDDGVGLDQLSGHVARFALLLLLLQLVHQVDGVVEADAFALVDGGDPPTPWRRGFCRCPFRRPGSGSAPFP